ncbi:MAG: chemotaxis response regulator protein-glutamate methylesterase [Planctomycetaceae bacterium]|nr:chemotaxis response regulator protein-glutamate methylesterase [Planctomycetaceae bacterium]
MSRFIRVLLADDSTVTRRILMEAISGESDMEVVGAAQNGEEAVALFNAHKPDVALFDVDMPKLNGIEALKAIRMTCQSVPVIMFSTLTVRGGEATLDALASGASDYVAKPTGVGHVDKAMEYLRSDVIPKLRQWGKVYKSKRESAPSAPVSSAASRPSAAVAIRPARLSDGRPPIKTSGKKRNGPIHVLAIGASTGGPNALAEIVAKLPADLGVPVLITQHMPPLFTQLLAERLDRCSGLTVREGYDGAVVKPGQAWVAPGDHHMVVARAPSGVVLRLNQAAPENSCRPAVDVMFRSVAQVYAGNSLAVVLTGMGKDGAAGCLQLSNAGGGVIVQDEDTSIVWGMPRAVAEAGVADAVLPLGEIARAIVSRIRGSSPLLASAAGA